MLSVEWLAAEFGLSEEKILQVVTDNLIHEDGQLRFGVHSGQWIQVYPRRNKAAASSAAASSAVASSTPPLLPLVSKAPPPKPRACIIVLP